MLLDAKSAASDVGPLMPIGHVVSLRGWHKLFCGERHAIHPPHALTTLIYYFLFTVITVCLCVSYLLILYTLYLPLSVYSRTLDLLTLYLLTVYEACDTQALSRLGTPPHSPVRAGAVGRVGRSRRVPPAYGAYRAASHRKRCRGFAPSPPTAAPARLRLALAPLRTPPHSVWRWTQTLGRNPNQA